jgi:sigma-B regulation protein RsbU (phosphoserine phosphatase)
MAEQYPSPRVLVADDQPDVLEALRFLLNGSGLLGEFVTSPAAVLDRLQGARYEALLIDLNYAGDTTSGAEGLALLTRVRERDPTLPVVVMTGWATIETAVEAMRRGARSLVQKPWDNAALIDILEREIADARAVRQRDDRRQRDDHDARLIQRSLLPEVPARLGPYELAVAWRPASGYGGDCYDVIPYDDGAVGLSIADVAGKGLPAALLMSNFQAAVRAFASSRTPPRELCANVNRLLCGHMISGRFVTCCYARLAANGRSLSYSNAGHNPPLLVRRDGSVDRLTAGGTILGVFGDAAYDERALALERGDRLVFFTDGITEACSPLDEEYGEARLLSAAARASGLAPVALVEAIFEEALAFSDGRLQDDASILALAVSE